MRLMAIVTCWFCKHKSKALIVFLILYVLLLSTAGISLHAASLNMFGRTLSVMSPAAWTVQSLLHWEFGSAPSSSLESNVRFACSSNPLVQHANAIVSRADCGIVLPEHLYSFLRMVSPQATDWTHALHIQFTSMLMLLVIWFIRLQTLDFNCTEFVPKSKTPLLQKKAKSLPKEVI